MIRLILLEAPDATASDIGDVLAKLQASFRMIAEEPGTGVAEDATAKDVHPNKRLVEELERRLQAAGVNAKKYDIVNVCGVDPPRFYKWQKGRQVSRNVRKACLQTVKLSAADFLKRLNAPPQQR
jgi:hypothetical protein